MFDFDLIEVKIIRRLLLPLSFLPLVSSQHDFSV